MNEDSSTAVRISRYLSGHLTASEAADFEADCGSTAALRHELERVLQLREGLERLRESGQLDQESHRTPTRRVWLFAASTAVIALTFFWWASYGPSSRPILTASLPAGASSSSPLQTLRFVAYRGQNSVAVLIKEKEGFIELKIRPDLPLAGGPNASYRTQLSLLTPNNRMNVIGIVNEVAIGTDGFVTVYVRSGELIPARYTISVEGNTHAEVSTHTGFEFDIR